jgi:hypothetical protein
MTTPSKDPTDLRGVPEEVLKLFEAHRHELIEFARDRHFELRAYETHDSVDGTWVWNLYGRPWGRQVCLQVSADPISAQRNRFNLWFYLYRRDLRGPQEANDLVEIKGWVGPADERLTKVLAAVARHAAQFAKSLPWKPTKPETV